MGDSISVQEDQPHLPEGEREEAVHLARWETVVDRPMLEVRCPRITLRLLRLCYRLGPGLALGPAA